MNNLRKIIAVLIVCAVIALSIAGVSLLFKCQNSGAEAGLRCSVDERTVTESYR